MTSASTADYRLQRLDASQLVLPNAWDIPVRLFAGEGVPIERAAVNELLGLLELQDTIAALVRKAPELFDHPDPGIVADALSSDFHKGGGIPIARWRRPASSCAAWASPRRCSARATARAAPWPVG